MLSPSSQYIPQHGSQDAVRRSQVLMWGGAAFVMLVWMGMIVGAPWAEAHGYHALAAILYKAFDPLCHQISERSFHLEGHAFAVCARCTGIYAGFAAGIIFYPLARSLKRTDTPSRWWLFVAAVPISIDWSLGFFGIWANTHLSRFLTGALLGVVCTLFVVPGLMDVLEVDWRRFFKNSPEARPKPETVLTVPPERVAPSDYSSPSSRI
ncbi:MAG TPA: DUF2085 domain-containing protein [Pyrinomonadaceae bacterium]|jgi:uncharacterized membrane protein